MLKCSYEDNDMSPPELEIVNFVIGIAVAAFAGYGYAQFARRLAGKDN